MAVHKLTNAVIYLGQYDVSTDHNMVEVPWGVESLDRTVFGDTTRRTMGGLFTADIKGQGFVDYNTGLIEDVLRSNLAVQNVPILVAGDGAAANARATFTQALTANVKVMGAQVGELHGFTWDAKPSNAPLVDGTVMAAKSARTTSSNSGTAQLLGAVSASQKMYAALYVFAASGTTPTLAVTVKSDDGVGFATPTTQITFTTATAVGAQFASSGSSITDTYWRVDWTIGGTTPSFTFAVAIGIL